jgi:3-oxoacyl-[acyl-carrier protein] reductase
MADRPLPLAGKVAIVTGSTRRIGRQIVKRLASDGASIVVTTRQSKQAMDETIKEIEAIGVPVMGHLADLTKEDEVKGLIDAVVKRFGHIDIIVHNAVDRNHDKLEDISLDKWRNTFAVIVDGGMMLAKYGSPHMRPGGSIVYLGGGSAFTGVANPAQPTAKMALVGLTRSLASALGPKGIRVNCVSPGRIEAVEDGPERLQMLRGGRPDDKIPLRRAGDIHDIADAIASVVSDDMRYVTAHTIHLTGGYYVG